MVSASQPHLDTCPCGSKSAYANCCQPYIENTKPAPTPEALMRSRYTAFVVQNVDYLLETMKGPLLEHFDPNETLAWIKNVTWVGLTVMKTKQKSDTLGFVSFDAAFDQNNERKHICEKSEFHRIDDRWYYVGGKPLNPHQKS